MKKIIKLLLLISMSILHTQLYAALTLQDGYSHEFSTVAGGIYKKSIKIKNTGNTAQEVKIYLEDYLFSADGTSNFTDARLRKNARSNSQWISFNPSRVVLAPNAEKTIAYTMKVPQDSFVGTYWSNLVIEPVADSSLESSKRQYNDKNVHMNVIQVIRHSIQIVSQMGDTGKANIQFKHPVMEIDSGKRVFSLDAYNIGNRWIRPKVWLDIYSQTGDFIGKFEGNGKRIYPNTSAALSVDITRLEKGKFKGLFVVDGGTSSEIIATDINLTIK